MPDKANAIAVTRKSKTQARYFKEVFTCAGLPSVHPSLDMLWSAIGEEMRERGPSEHEFSSSFIFLRKCICTHVGSITLCVIFRSIIFTELHALFNFRCNLTFITQKSVQGCKNGYSRMVLSYLKLNVASFSQESNPDHKICVFISVYCIGHCLTSR